MAFKEIVILVEPLCPAALSRNHTLIENFGLKPQSRVYREIKYVLCNAEIALEIILLHVKRSSKNTEKYFVTWEYQVLIDFQFRN